jgi:hypothetical protein
LGLFYALLVYSVVPARIMACSIEKWNPYTHSWVHFGGVTTVGVYSPGIRAAYVNAHDEHKNCKFLAYVV